MKSRVTATGPAGPEPIKRKTSLPEISKRNTPYSVAVGMSKMICGAGRAATSGEAFGGLVSSLATTVRRGLSVAMSPSMEIMLIEISSDGLGSVGECEQPMTKPKIGSKSMDRVFIGASYRGLQFAVGCVAFATLVLTISCAGGVLSIESWDEGEVGPVGCVAGGAVVGAHAPGFVYASGGVADGSSAVGGV